MSNLSIEKLADVERDHILKALILCDGNRSDAARILGIALRTLRNKINRYRRDGHQVVPSKRYYGRTKQAGN